MSPGIASGVLEARGLHRFYRRGDEEIPALRDVSLTVAPGEMVADVGPSGSGKSTLLHLLAGLDNPDGGSVWLDGQRFSHRRPAEQARLRGRHIGVLTQGSGLVEHLSVAGNVRLAASFRGPGRVPSRADSPPRGDGLLTELGIAARAHARPSTVSGGETARANLAVALAGGPLVLLADEPPGRSAARRREPSSRFSAGSVQRPAPPSWSPTPRRWRRPRTASWR